MKTLKIVSVIITVFLFLSPHAAAQTADSVYAFYPLHVGDKWEHDWGDYITNPPSHLYYQTTEVLSDTTMSNGLHYYLVRTVYSYSGRPYDAFQRVDSADGYVHLWSEGDTRSAIYIRSAARHVDTVFGVPVEVRTSGYIEKTCDLAYGYGIVVQRESGAGWPDRSRIIYARVKGVEFGTPLAVLQAPLGPGHFELRQNYPNPFNPSTTIRFTLVHSGQVTLKVYNLLGQEIATLLSGSELAGSHEVRFDAAGLPSGVYLYRLQTAGLSIAKPMILLK
jgi:hypothetical protein